MKQEFWLVFIAGLCLGGILVYLEVKRPDGGRLTLRILASLIAVASLLLLIVPVGYKIRTKQKAATLNLLTPGVTADMLKSIQGKKLYTANRQLFEEHRKEGVQFIQDLQYFIHADSTIKNVTVFGTGLNRQTLSRLGPVNINFYASAQQEGIRSCTWNNQLNEREILQVQGTYNNRQNRPVKLLLYGSGAGADSVIIGKRTLAKFTLSHQPQQTGKALYHLIALAGKDTISEEKIPFIVQPARPFSVLMLASSPDFEYKFLKNWLYANKYPLIFRSRISKDKLSTQFLNSKRSQLNSVTRQMLDTTALLIIDGDEYARISSAEKNTIRNAVQRGMGLLERAGAPKADAAGFSIYAKQQNGRQQHQIRLTGTRATMPIAIDEPLFINSANYGRPLVTDDAGRILVNSRLLGTGRVAASTVPSTFAWVLAGDTTMYARYWTTLLSAIARKNKPAATWQISPALPVAGQFTSAVLEDPATGITPSIRYRTINLSPLQNSYLPWKWQVNFWPKTVGWTSLTAGKKDALTIYVFGPDDWQSVRTWDMMQATRQKADEQKDATVDDILVIEEKQIGKGWFFFLFLVSAGFLWAEPRLFINQ